MTDDAPVTAAGEWEEAKHPRGEHGHFRKLDEIMGDLTKETGGYGGSGKVGQARQAIRQGKRAQARTILDGIAAGHDNPRVKALASEAADRLKPIKVGKGVGEAKPGYGAVVHQVHHPDHGHIGSIEKHIDQHHITAPGQNISIGTTNTTSYRAIPKGVNPYSPRARREGGVGDFRTRAEAEHHLAEHADAQAIAQAAGAPGSDASVPGDTAPTPATPAAKAKAMISEARGAADGLKGRRKMTAGPGYDPIAHAHDRLDSAEKALDSGDHRTAATAMAHAANVFDTGGDSETAQRLRNARSELRGSPAIPADEPSRGDTPHGNTPGSPYEPLGNARPDVAVIPEGQLVPDHVNSNFKGSLFDRQGNRFYRAQSGDIMADRPHDGEAPNSNVRKLEHATPEEQAAFERASAVDSSMGGGPGTPAWDRMMPSEVQTGDTIAHPASNRPIKVNNVVHGPHGVTVTHDDNGTERNVLLPHQTPVARITAPAVGEAPGGRDTRSDSQVLDDLDNRLTVRQHGEILKGTHDHGLTVREHSLLRRRAEQQGVPVGPTAPATSVPEISRAQEVAGERRDVAASNAESIAGDNLPKGYGIQRVGINAGPNNPSGDPAYVPVHNADGAIGPAHPDREVAKQAIRDHAAGRMRSGADALRQAAPDANEDPVEWDANATKAWKDIHPDFKSKNADGTRSVLARTRRGATISVPWRGPEGATPAADRPATIMNRPDPVDAQTVMQRHDLPTLQRMARDKNLRFQDRQAAQAEIARRAVTRPEDKPLGHDAGFSPSSDDYNEAPGRIKPGDFIQTRTGNVFRVTGVDRMTDGKNRYDVESSRGLPNSFQSNEVTRVAPIPKDAPDGTAQRSTTNKPVGSIVHVRQPGGTQRLGTVTAVDGQHRHVELNPIGGGTQKQKIRVHASQITPVENGPAPSRPVASPGGRSAKAQRAFQAASEGDHKWLEDHGFDARPGDSIHVNDDTGHIALGKPDGTHSVHRVNGNGQAAGMGQRQPGMGPGDGFRTVHEPRTGGTAMPTGSAPDGGVRGTQSDNPGAKAMTERILANRAAEGAPATSGDATPMGRVFKTRDAADAQVARDRKWIEEGSGGARTVEARQVPGGWQVHAVNKTPTGTTPVDAPAAGLDKYGVPADKTNQQLGAAMPTLPADHRQIADDLKMKYMTTGPEHDRGIADDLRRYYLLNNQGGRDDEAAYWLRSAEEQAARKDSGGTPIVNGVYKTEEPRVMHGGMTARQVYKGRDLEVRKGKEWGTLGTYVNGQLIGTPSGTRPEQVQRELDSLRKYVDAADEQPGNYGDYFRPLPKYAPKA